MAGHIPLQEGPEPLEEFEPLAFGSDGKAKEYHPGRGETAAEDQLAEVLVGGKNHSLLLCRQAEDGAIGQSGIENLGVKHLVAQTLEVGNHRAADMSIGEQFHAW
jgi:hypothetical protein